MRTRQGRSRRRKRPGAILSKREAHAKRLNQGLFRGARTVPAPPMLGVIAYFTIGLLDNRRIAGIIWERISHAQPGEPNAWLSKVE